MENLEIVNGNLGARGFISCIAGDRHEAAIAALTIIGGGSVGIGGSLTVKETGLAEELKGRGNDVYWHWLSGNEAKFGAGLADYYVCSANAVTEDGRIILSDGSGNRVAGLSFGPKNAILIVGKNKIVKNVEEGLKRIRSGICAGANAKRLGLSTPCAKGLPCSECTPAETICSVTAVFDRPSRGLKNTYVILVGENLGL